MLIDKLFSTDDRYLAAWLYLKGVKLEGRGSGGHFLIFLFESGPRTEALVKEFDLTEPIGSYVEALRVINDMIRTHKSRQA